MKNRDISLLVTSAIFASFSLFSCGTNAPSSSQPSSSIPSSSSSSSNSQKSSSSSRSSSSSSSLKEFEGIVFEDETVVYDGKTHTIAPTNVPSFASYTYKGTRYYSEINESGYTITIQVTATGYKTATYTAKLYIVGKPFDALVFEDVTHIEDFTEHKLEVKGAPSGASITYKCLNHADVTNAASQIGEYRIQATVSLKYYQTTTLTATMKIVPSDFIKVDSSKKAFEFNADTPRETILNELHKGNFTVSSSFESVRSIVSSGKEYAHYYSSITDYALDGDNYIYVYKGYKDSKTHNEFNSFILESAHVVGEYSLSAYKYYEGSPLFYKAPAESYKETYQKLAYYLDAYTIETEEDKFKGIVTKGYVSDYYECEVGTNVITLKIHNYYYHENDTGVNEPIVNDELTIYKFTNIGNTAIEADDSIVGKIEDVDSYDYGSFTLDTIDYSEFNDVYTASIELSYLDIAMNDKDTFILRATFFDLPVRNMKRKYYLELDDWTGYTLNVYFNSSGQYQGEYENLGKIIPGSNTKLNTWSTYGGTLHYYGEW